jgi:hypothetical protein
MFDKSPGSAVVRLSAEESDAEAARLTWMLAEIEQREREINALQAEQALAVAEYAEGRARLEGSAVWAWDEKPRRICAMELADARGVGGHAAHSHLDASLALVTTTPCIFDRFAAGMITLAAARAAVDEIGWVRPEQQLAVDEIVAEEIDQVLPGQVRTMTRTRCMEIDPDSAVRAAAHNRAQRYVQVVPSTMTGMALRRRRCR